MKKILMPLVLLALVLVSCEEENTALNVNDLPTITMSGKVTAELDATLAGEEAVPDGTKLIFNVKYGTTGSHQVIATTAGGEYTATIPVVQGKTTVDIDGENFIANYKASDGGSISKLYSITTQADIACNKENNLVKKVTFGSGVAIDNSNIIPTGSITYSGTLKFPSVAFNGDSIVPVGTTFNVEITLTDQSSTYTYKTVQVVTVGAGGAYSITIPMIKNGLASIKAVDTEQFWVDKVDATKNGVFRYTLTLTDSGLYNTNYTNKDYKYVKGALQNEIPVTTN